MAKGILAVHGHASKRSRKSQVQRRTGLKPSLVGERLWKQHFNNLGFRVILIEKFDCHELWRVRLRRSLSAQSYLLLSKPVPAKWANSPDLQEKQLMAEIHRIAQDMGLPIKRDCLSVSRTGAYFQASFLWAKGQPGLLLRSEAKPNAFAFLIRPWLKLLHN